MQVRCEFVVGISKSGCAGDHWQLDELWQALRLIIGARRVITAN
jgi:hypothetical protein